MDTNHPGKGRRILVINQYFAPDTASTGLVLASLCEGLAQQGFKIAVICGFPCYTEDAPEAPAVETKPGLTIYRVGTGGVKGRSGIRRRFQGYIGFMFAAWSKIRRLSVQEHFDAVITVTNPPFVGLLGVMARHKFKCPFVYIIHDLHPDILVKTGRLHPGLITWLWDRLNKLIFDSAAVIVVLGERMREYLQGKGVVGKKIEAIHNWSIHDISPRDKINSFRKTYGLGERFVVLYAGNMGISHNLEYLIEAASKIEEDVLFLFVGNGEKKAELQAAAQKRGLTNVMFLPYQPDAVLNDMLAAADVCVVALELELTGMAVPSKTYTILASGRPILVIGSPDNEVAQIVHQWGCGWVAATPGQTSEVLKRLVVSPEEVSRAGENAVQAYQQNFCREKAMARYMKVLNTVLDKP